jgi:hypothetical protein
MHYKSSNPLGLVYLTVGLVLFFVVAGAFLLRLLVAIIALWLIFYGLQVWQGGQSRMVFWQYKNRNDF